MQSGCGALHRQSAGAVLCLSVLAHSCWENSCCQHQIPALTEDMRQKLDINSFLIKEEVEFTGWFERNFSS